jgi:hypothetical protein
MNRVWCPGYQIFPSAHQVLPQISHLHLMRSLAFSGAMCPPGYVVIVSSEIPDDPHLIHCFAWLFRGLGFSRPLSAMV